MGKPQCYGVKQSICSAAFCSASIATGTSERAMDEAKIGRATAIVFGTLWILMLALNMLSYR
jgi:hypothetical protein